MIDFPTTSNKTLGLLDPLDGVGRNREVFGHGEIVVEVFINVKS